MKLTNYSAGVIAWGNKGKGIGRKYVHTPDLNADFHVWGCEFTPETVKFFFDGQLTHQADATKLQAGTAEYLADDASPAVMGGTWGVDGKLLPAVAQFDYVRYFTKLSP